jgi:Xaa-Pro aminopeptidase
MKNVRQKVDALRRQMSAAGIAACIIPSSDPHLSEYLPERWKTRQWISGFTGSAGTAVVTHKKAGLWTDSRYFLQAEKELQDSGFELFKIGVSGTPDYTDWIIGELRAGDCVGVEGEVFSAADTQNFIKKFSKKEINLKTDFVPYDFIWEDRPAIPKNSAFILDEKFSGKSCREKINDLRKILKAKNAETIICSSLDTTACLFNLRGNDIEYNPVCIAFSVISLTNVALFVSPQAIDGETQKYLENQGVTVFDYNNIYEYLEKQAGARFLITPSKINYKLYCAIPENCIKIEIPVHPVDEMKSVKNKTEIEGIRAAMRRDGAAMVKFLVWLESSLQNGKITEISVAEKLRELRSEQDFFVGESFATIAGYAAHGAIVHYEADAETNSVLCEENLLLVDSGAQYFDGTTDITRTIALGKPTERMKRDFTLVLKGLIALSTACFPEGTVGMQLDILARQFLWKDNLTYLHGTGHGVGHFLNVHEGVQSIRTNFNPAEIKAGMITSCEPGVYRAGQYGIRLENLLLAVEKGETEFGKFLAFETLTLCPIDTSLIDFALLTETEISWIKEYHQTVYEQLSPLLTEKEREWLAVEFCDIKTKTLSLYGFFRF